MTCQLRRKNKLCMVNRVIQQLLSLTFSSLLNQTADIGNNIDILAQDSLHISSRIKKLHVWQTFFLKDEPQGTELYPTITQVTLYLSVPVTSHSLMTLVWAWAWHHWGCLTCLVLSRVLTNPRPHCWFNLNWDVAHSSSPADKPRSCSWYALVFPNKWLW